MRRFASLRLASLALVLVGAARPASADDAPKIRVIRPSSAPRGGTVDVDIEGANLHPFQEIRTNRGEISVVPQPGASPNKVTIRLTIPDDAPAGPVSISIRTKDGGATTDRFSVKLRSPTVTRITPSVLARGAEATLRFEGMNLFFVGQETKVTVAAPATVKLEGKPSGTSISVRLLVPPTTPPGLLPVVVETVDGKFAANVTVALAPPSIAGVTPAALARGATVEAKITGKNLAG